MKNNVRENFDNLARYFNGKKQFPKKIKQNLEQLVNYFKKGEKTKNKPRLQN